MKYNDFKAGDLIRCKTTKYSTYLFGSITRVKDAKENNDGDSLILLVNPMSEAGVGWYYACNFEVIGRPKYYQKENNQMAAYEKTKYFAAKVINMEPTSFIDLAENGQTMLRDSKHQTIKDVESLITTGERWVILKLEAMIEPEDPKPPIKITEYK